MPLFGKKSKSAEGGLQLMPYMPLKEILCKRKVVGATVAYDGSLILLAVEQKDVKVPFPIFEQPGWASFPETKSRDAYKAWLLRIDDSVRQDVEVAVLDNAFPYVDGFPDGSFIVASARCRYDGHSGELNASIYDQNGAPQKQMCLGDGINDVAVSSASLIWTSYFDEGVFGNFGWGGGNSPPPIGAHGLVCFDREGSQVWQYPNLEEGVEYSIDDCYAMTIANDEVWLCFYSDFPLAHIDSRKQIKYWNNQIAGASTIAIDADKVLLYGGYSEDKTRICVQQCSEDGQIRSVFEGKLQLPEADKFMSVKGRCGALHVITDDCWHKLSISDI